MTKAEYAELPVHCLVLLQRVWRKSGCQLQIREYPVLEFDSELQLAKPGHSAHTLSYLANYRRHLPHFVVNSCFKILRVWKAPAEERYVPASQVGMTLPEPYHRELVQKLELLPQGDREQYAEQTSRFLAGALARQLTSFPVDLRVEDEIRRTWPMQEEGQRAYLKCQVNDFLHTLDEGLLRLVPEGVYRASTAMNIAFTVSAAELVGVSLDPKVRQHCSRGLAEQLLHHLKTISEQGIRGDRLLTDAWAHELRLEGWYEWVRLGEAET